MDVVISDEAREFIASRGGSLFVRAKNQRCCSGALVILQTATEVPRDAGEFLPVAADGFDLFYRGSERGQPRQLLIELKGRRRPHLAAFKDGCAYPVN